MEENIKTITLEDILLAKEARKVRQDDFRSKYKLPLVSITINMPGNIKDTKATRDLCSTAVEGLMRCFQVVAHDRVNLKTGPEAIVAIEGRVEDIKKHCIKLEEEHSFSRLLDLDVFSAEGKQYSRRDNGQGRKCLICGEDAVICMRERKHSQAALNEAVQKLLVAFSAQQTWQLCPIATKIASFAVEAMLYEVSCTPAPGLVDRANSGAHTDMDFFTFMSSSAALATTMARCVKAGLNHDGELPKLLPVLRYIGIEGEQDMLSSTSGINTQKGIIFSLGIIAAAVGWVMKEGFSPTASKVMDTTQAIVAGIVERDLGSGLRQNVVKLTAGERLYIKYGIRGIRGEMEDGLPSVREKALPALKEALAKGLSVNDALVQTLLILMTCVDDTTVMNRHNPEKMSVWVRAKINEVLVDGGMYTVQGKGMAEQLDKEFILQNISPGGAADLLAVSWFIMLCEKQV